MKPLNFYFGMVKEYYIKSKHLISKYLSLNAGTEISECIIIQFSVFAFGIYYFPNKNFYLIYTLTFIMRKNVTHIDTPCFSIDFPF